MSLAIVYSSKTGNTEELVKELYRLFLLNNVKVDLFRVDEFNLDSLQNYEAVIIGTYTWGAGEVPTEMLPLYQAFETQNVKHMITGVVGTGDRFYAHFCGAVDEFRDMLYVKTNLAVTLKVELSPQGKDLEKCQKFVELFLIRVRSQVLI